jgi:heme-degrading monooxygenase HmoA
MSVTFINCFEVAPEADTDFLEYWDKISTYLAGHPGYQSHAMHRALGEDARYRFVNVVRWRTAEEFAAAHDDGFRALVDPDSPYQSVQAVYEVIVTVAAEGGTERFPFPTSGEGERRGEGADQVVDHDHTKPGAPG